MNIVIKIDGANRTADIDFRTAKFTGRSSGRSGDVVLRLLDTAHVWARTDLHTGQTVELILDGTRVWDGYVFNVGRGYAFDVDDTSHPMATPRYITVKGADRNVLLSKRVVFGQDDPLDQPKRWPSETSDREAILWMQEHFLDLLDLDIDLDSGIDEVASPGPYEEFLLGSTGAPWGVIYEDCAKITGAVYAIWPTDRAIHYHDDLTVTAPAILCDRPFLHDEGDAYGYRECVNSLDTSEMATDAFVWGAGRGSAEPVFYRYTNPDALASFGRWQWSDQWVGANRTFTVKKRAESYVDGSTTHQRGHGQELPHVQLVVFDRIFWAGMVARYHSHIFDVNMPLPVREVVYEFPTNDSVKLTLTLTLEYDTPFGWIDPWGSDETIPVGDPRNDNPTSTEGGEVIDEFDRDWHSTDAGWIDNTWGTATNGYLWVDAEVTSAFDFVDGDFGWESGLERGDDDQSHGSLKYLDWTPQMPFSCIYRWQIVGGDSAYGIDIGLTSVGAFFGPPTNSVGNVGLVRYHLGPLDTGLAVLDRRGGIYAYKDIRGGDLALEMRARFELTEGGFRCRLWIEDLGEPTDWDVDITWDDFVAANGLLNITLDDPITPRVDIDWYSGNLTFTGTSLNIDWVRRTGELGEGITITGVDEGVAGWTGYDDIYQTAYPYQPGSLEITFQGISLRSGVDFFEVDPENGTFRVAPDAPGLASADNSSELVVHYEAASAKPTSPAPVGGVVGDTGGGSHPYRPAKQQQLGWGTPFDGTNCAATTSAMCLDRHTLGAFSATQGSPRATPPSIRYYSGNRALTGGLNQHDCQRAWRVGWDKNLTYPGFHNWSYFVAAIRQGRGAAFSGIYGVLPDRLRFSRTFRGPHSIYVNEELPDGNYLVFDPLTRKSLVYTPEILKHYGETFTGINGTVSASYSRVTE